MTRIQPHLSVLRLPFLHSRLALVGILGLGLPLIACSESESPSLNSGSSAPATSAPNNKDSSPSKPNETGAQSSGETTTQEDTYPLSELHGACMKDSHCKSGICKFIERPNGDDMATYIGVCAACRDHRYCIENNLGFGCNLDYEAGHFKCGDGTLGNACETNENCAPQLICALLNLGDNDSFTRVCSECAKHTDCPSDGNRNCIARYNPNDQMFNQCLPDKARKMGEICFPCETGDRECDGVCAPAQDPNAGNGLCIGVCGECKSNKDCPEGEICQPPEFHFDNAGSETPHTPSRCVKPGGGI